jgi:molybdenum cofactor cytidylyltransferase
VYVVLGAHQPAIRAALDFTGVEVLDNIHWREGIAASIRLAVATLPATCPAVLFVAADQARLDTSQLHALILLWQQHPQQMAAAAYGNLVGIPALFPRASFAELLTLRGDTGARKLLLQSPLGLVTLAMPAALIDIDTVADLERCPC